MAYGFNNDKSKYDLNTILENFGTVETGSTASQAYAAGDLIVYGSRLCKVSSSIAQGDTLAVGTNIEEITVAAVSVMPPDFSAMETAREWRSQTDSFTEDVTIVNDGWYSLEISKSTESQITYGQAHVYLSPHYENTRPVALIGNFTNGYFTTPWLYFKAGNVIRIVCSAEDAFLRYAPCM